MAQASKSKKTSNDNLSSSLSCKIKLIKMKMKKSKPSKKNKNFKSKSRTKESLFEAIIKHNEQQKVCDDAKVTRSKKEMASRAKTASSVNAWNSLNSNQLSTNNGSKIRRQCMVSVSKFKDSDQCVNDELRKKFFGQNSTGNSVPNVVMNVDNTDRITEMNSNFVPGSNEETRFSTFLSRFNYDVLEELGAGGFSKVYKVRNRNNPNVFYACKIFDLLRIDESWSQRCLYQEMNIMFTIFHPNIIQLRDSIKTRHSAYIMMDFAANGNISSYIYRQKAPLNEIQARIWFRDIMSAVSYLHNKRIAHRDLKLENYLIDESYKALLSDFSFSVTIDQSNSDLMRKTVCGTSSYMAPEIHTLKDDQSYDPFASDMFSMGVCLFEMINYDNPFEGEFGSPELVQIIMTRNYSLKPNIVVAKECKELIDGLLEPTPARRPTAKEVIANPWLYSMK